MIMDGLSEHRIRGAAKRPAYTYTIGEPTECPFNHLVGE